jgi:D-cysteine desulfhydrase
MEAPRLSSRLGAPVYIKRDDLTGLALGGNKGRSLQYLMTQPLEIGADLILAAGPQQSNWLCNLTAAASKLGMKTILFLLKGTNELQGNMLLEKLLGAEFIFTDIEMGDIEKVYARMDTMAAELRKQGRKPFIFRYGAVDPLGITGYVSLAEEITRQLREKQLSAGYLFVGSGSGCTQAGLSIGARLYQSPFKLIGVSVSEKRSGEEQSRIMAEEANGACQYLDVRSDFGPEDFSCLDQYVISYAPTRDSVSAVKLLAETEGVFIDPLYTGKVLAAIIDQVRKRKIAAEKGIILYHSGGTPGVFSNGRELIV